jgi:hypothetical protein
MTPVAGRPAFPGAGLHRARDHDGSCLLAMDLSASGWPELRGPRLAGLRLEEMAGSAGGTRLCLRLVDDQYGDLSHRSAMMPSRRCHGCGRCTRSDDRAGVVLAGRAWSWQELLRRASARSLSLEQQMALQGGLLARFSRLSSVLPTPLHRGRSPSEGRRTSSLGTSGSRPRHVGQQAVAP